MNSAFHPLIGIGWRPPHYQALLTERPPLGWIEVHSENYFNPHGEARAWLRQAACHYPISLHGVGMSLGSADPLDGQHLRQLRQLVDEMKPIRLSEHLSWSSVDGRFFNDLLPMPYTRAALAHFADKVSAVQDALGRRLLIENPSSYLMFAAAELTEWEFLARLQRQTDCGLLLDLNNLYVSAHNHGFDPEVYLAALDPGSVEEIHLAGYSEKQLPGGSIYIDTHSAPVVDGVWQLYRQWVAHHPVLTLIEWDLDIPPLEVLLAEAGKAATILEACHERAA
ncbi:MNIO family bufferin maturase [Aeromonas diversa]|uniref:MNIO family bufferin maturase n=1 Tax=Aeromonas diversa TaxID=502790 RepID=UPI00346180E3